MSDRFRDLTVTRVRRKTRYWQGIIAFFFFVSPSLDESSCPSTEMQFSAGVDS